MKRAEHRDAVLKQKFYFRTNPDEETPKILELSCDEVINGGRGFFGLIPYMKKYLDDSGTDIKTRCKILVSLLVFIWFYEYIRVWRVFDKWKYFLIQDIIFNFFYKL